MKKKRKTKPRLRRKKRASHELVLSFDELTCLRESTFKYPTYCPCRRETVRVVSDLIGLPWRKYALAQVGRVRPTAVRVYVITMPDQHRKDFMPWRITVYLEKDDKTIRSVWQEVEIPII